MRLAALLADRNRPQKHVARVRSILHSAERIDVSEVARRAGLSRPAVWRWQHLPVKHCPSGTRCAKAMVLDRLTRSLALA